MFDLSDTGKIVEACREVARHLTAAERQPLEREAAYTLGKMLHIQIMQQNLIDNPDIQEFLNVMKNAPHRLSSVRRFPQDFNI
jgi:hypothetical protein